MLHLIGIRIQRFGFNLSFSIAEIKCCDISVLCVDKIESKTIVIIITPA